MVLSNEFAGPSNHNLRILSKISHSKIDVFGPGKSKTLPYATGTTRSDIIAVFTGDADDLPESAVPGPVATAATAEVLASSLGAYRTCTSPAQGWLMI